MPMRIEPSDAGVYRGGACSRCLDQTNGLIDADINIDYEGPLALCEGCIADLATTAGFALTADYAKRLEVAEHRASIAESTVATLQDTLDRVAAAARKPVAMRRA